ncbi:MAG: hypothetical protein ACAH80_11205 [Alphaproteobacteria bacterium]
MDLGLAAMKGFTLAALTVCPLPSEIPKVNVYFFPKKAEYITEAPVKALTASALKLPDAPAASPGQAYYVYSLLESRVFESGTKVTLDITKDQEGNTCYSVDKVDMVIQYKPTVFIAKELKEFPCHSLEARTREDSHIAIDVKTLNEFVPKLKMEFLWHLRALGVQGPFAATEADQQAEKIRKGIHSSTKPIIEKMAAELSKRHDAATSQETYLKDGKCGAEKASLGGIIAAGMK